MFDNYRYVTDCSQVRFYGSDHEDDSEDNDVTDYYLRLFADNKSNGRLNKTTLNVAFNHPDIPLSGALRLLKSLRNIFTDQKVDVFIVLTDTVDNQWYSYHTLTKGTIDAVYDAVYKKPEKTPQVWAYSRHWEQLLLIVRYFQIKDAVSQAEALLKRDDISIYEVQLKRCADNFNTKYPPGMYPLVEVKLPEKIMKKFTQSDHTTDERMLRYRSGQTQWFRITSLTEDMDLERKHLEDAARIIGIIQDEGLDFKKFGIYYNSYSKVMYFIGTFELVDYTDKSGQRDCGSVTVGDFMLKKSVTSTYGDRLQKLNMLYSDGLTLDDYHTIWKIAEKQARIANIW